MNLRMARKRTETATELSKEIKARGKSTRVKKCTMKKTSTTNKFHESGKHNSEREEKKSPLKPSAESPSSQDQTPIHTVPNHDSSKEVRPSKKMKLQLFPLDTHTCKGLEKDGFHPYLELTLSSRKKISSVLQHIQSKWGSSKIAQGDVALYPYDKSLLASSSHKWKAKSNITTTTTGDVYAAIGSPTLFRLRYGWCSETENKTDEPLPSPSTPETRACFQNEKPHNIIGNSENQVTDPPPHDGQIESTENNGSGLLPWDYDGGLSIGGLLSEVSLKGKFGNPKTAVPWDDNLTNISLGGFFSESSLQRFIKHEPEDKNNQPSLSIGGYFSEASLQRIGLFPLEGEGRQEQQQLPLISDSLDAFFANRTAFLLPPSQPSSILDAEDTCQPFSFRKRFTTTSEKVSEEAVKDESKSGKVGSSMVFNQDSKLSAIKWDESRGQFDLGVSSSQKFGNGDSISLGAFVKDLEEKIEPLEEKTKQ